MRFLMFFSLWGLVLAAQAKCGSGGLYAYPSDEAISSNSMFLLVGYARSGDVVSNLNVHYPVYLLSDKGEKVKLIVKEYNEGQFALVQALLWAEKELNTGETYTLMIDSMPPYEVLERYNYTLEKYEKVRFTVSKAADRDKPVCKSGPVFEKEQYELLGCGPLHYLHFGIGMQDHSMLLVKAMVTEIGSGIRTTYYELSEGRKVVLGYGMCSGAFLFRNDITYEVHFSFMDMSGNEADVNPEPLRIHVAAPTGLTK